ncbi:MAG: hypothetical protein IJT59_05460 [Desulfovibrionaceae bacterium]|nr:hypothetical protein [Desulfovibrionaceae bacterium]
MPKNIICLVLTLLLLISCAPQKKTTLAIVDAETTWSKYLDRRATLDPYRMQLSIRLGLRGDTRRVTAIVWGHNTETVRLDVMAGVGATVAQIYADPENFLVVAPMDNKAYTHHGTNKPLLKIGVPLPLNLKNLADLLCGNLPAVFGQRSGDAQLKKDSLVTFNLLGRLPGSIDVDGLGHVVRWEEKPHGGNGWIMDIAYGEEDDLPSKISLENRSGQRAIVVVRSRESAQDLPLTPMKLTIPQGFKVLPLAKYAAENI